MCVKTVGASAMRTHLAVYHPVFVQIGNGCSALLTENGVQRHIGSAHGTLRRFLRYGGGNASEHVGMQFSYVHRRRGESFFRNGRRLQ